MNYRHLITRIRQFVVVVLLGLLMGVTFLGIAPTTSHVIAEGPTPTPASTSGWDDPVGG